MSEENPQPDPSGVKPQTSTPFGSLNDLQSVNLGQNEYFSTRDVISNSQRGYPFRGGDSPLVYPVDLAANTKSNRQSAALRFVPYKRESSQVRVELLKTNGSISGLGVGDVGESGEIEQGAFFNVNDDGVDVNYINENEGTIRGAYGPVGGAGGQSFLQQLTGSGTPPTPEQLGQFVEKIGSDVRLSRSGNQKLEEIIMYCPGGLNFNDSVSYAEASAGAFNSVVEALAGNFQAGADKLKLLGVGKLSKLIGKVPGVGEDALTNFFTARYGIVENQRMESLFESVNRKKFQFEFQFAPRSQEESIIVLNIIEAFRFHMLPELSLSGAMLLAPHEFEVEILIKDPGGAYEINRNIPQIGRAFLESVNVDYAPNDRSAFFYDGVPCEIKVQLSFSQALLMNRQLVLAGF
tara:strand:+ start:4592 stop:5812 length:1221 start_codon:yes stop_codon:yes gene_type:complete